MALEGVRQTFAIESASDLIDKLEWEISLFKEEDRLPCKIWLAWNCAVTAWSIADWVYEEFDQVQREYSNNKNYHNYLCLQSRALYVCRQIATASKHRLKTEKLYDKNLESCVAIKAVSFSFGNCTADADFYVIDNTVKKLAVDVFRDAQTFLDGEIRRYPLSETLPKYLLQD